MRSTRTTIRKLLNIIMRSQSSGRPSRGRSRGGRSRSRGSNNNDRGPRQESARPAAKKGFWQRVAAFFGNGDSPAKPRPTPQRANGAAPRSESSSRPQRRPETVEVTSPRLYVGNLSFDATESDLFELFNGVGKVENAEVVTYKHNQRSKGFAFVQMQSTDEAQRAVKELHDKEFLGRKLVVSGAKSTEHARE